MSLTTEAGWIGTKTGEAKQVTFLLREITEGGEGELVVLVGSPRDLARIERSRDLVLDLLKERLSQEEVLATLRVERAKEPELVFDDWTTDVKSGVDFGVTIRSSARERNSRVLTVANQSLRLRSRRTHHRETRWFRSW